ncbi:MAG: hypothetical protein ACXWIN_02785 [Burkholderiaceae bacterium]
MSIVNKARLLLCVGLSAVLLQGCKIDSIINGTVANGSPNPNTTLAWSEGSTFTPDGRFFVIGGNKPFTVSASGLTVNGTTSIYEVTKNPDGTYRNTSIVDGSVSGNPCYFGGLTSVRYMLYASCTNISGLSYTSTLYRVDLTKAKNDPSRIATAQLLTPAFQPNGISVDQNGDLYIPNSIAFLATAYYGVPNVPAIVKVKITDEANFRISESGWLPALLGGFSPNGAAIQSNQLYLPSLNVIYRIPILANGSAGIPVIVYQGPKTDLFDAVTVLPGNLIAVPEITNPDPNLVQMVYPGTPPATTLTTQVTLVDMTSGKALGAAAFPSYARPSSVTVSQGSLFPLGSAVVTDAIGAGGLYLLRQ